ncbi:MAG TPA: zinc ribbon domain-containing protein, partial [Actinobacteria bacterium]|nr:zinc ribbon domain-containing protein [Actinomycetes bacterium]HEX21633.1 zinc ribbon domain-containing protein [Actinomycetota bacterium]
MPLYEYHCQKCKHNFELLVGVGAADDSLSCPHCGSDD